MSLDGIFKTRYQTTDWRVYGRRFISYRCCRNTLFSLDKMATKTRPSRVVVEIEKCRGNANWAKLEDLAKQLAYKSPSQGEGLVKGRSRSHRHSPMQTGDVRGRCRARARPCPAVAVPVPVPGPCPCPCPWPCHGIAIGLSRGRGRGRRP